MAVRGHSIARLKPGNGDRLSLTMQRSEHRSSFQQPDSLTGVKREEVGCKIRGTEVVGIELYAIEPRRSTAPGEQDGKLWYLWANDTGRYSHIAVFIDIVLNDPIQPR